MTDLPEHGIKDLEVGEKIVITEECLERMRSHSRQAAHPGYPSDSFLAKAKECVGVPGVVTHRFTPGYELTGKFGDQYLHLKDNWVERSS